MRLFPNNFVSNSLKDLCWKLVLLIVVLWVYYITDGRAID
jgi:hypothetical protein